MKALKRTITVYGIFGLLIMATFLTLKTVGVDAGDIRVLLLPFAVLFLMLGAFLDFFGLFCVILAWLPFTLAFLQIEIGIITFSPFVLGMIAFAILNIFRLITTNQKYGFGALDVVIVLLCLTFLASTFSAANIVESGHLAFHAFFVPVVSYFTIKGMVTSEERYRQAMIFFLVGISIFGVIAIGHFVITHERGAVLSVPFIGVATLATTAFMYLFYLPNLKSRARSLSMIINLGSLLSTLSRVYLIFLLMSKWLLRLIRGGHAFALMLVLLVTTFIGTLFVTYNAETFRPAKFDTKMLEMDATTERITSLEYWKIAIYQRAFTYRDALDNFTHRPLIGFGIYKGKVNITRHNLYVAWLEYGGLIGFTLYFLLFLVHFWIVGKKAVSDQICAVNLLIILIIVANGVTNGLTHGMMPYVVFMLMGFNEARLKLLRSSYRENSC